MADPPSDLDEVGQNNAVVRAAAVVKDRGGRQSQRIDDDLALRDF